MTAPKLPDLITLMLPPEQVNLVLGALGQRPYVESAAAIGVIKEQADACVREFNTPPAAEEPPHTEHELAPLNRAARRARKPARLDALEPADDTTLPLPFIDTLLRG